jgi:hypothetical protein
MDLACSGESPVVDPREHDNERSSSEKEGRFLYACPLSDCQLFDENYSMDLFIIIAETVLAM